ncbi:MAG: hypothetical protein GWO16_01735, partial [Gammaproteobacteria bacterium]|nr:hypothetical protein [Gammaproteobacteria bacterium]NIR96857.1 hypothetical protein [Gammaproteobacteria bacterium]NIT62566.1 hypothetical protein [Gammaproteobacteria bacterium]NIV19510.1 hypothetical protein [Gammaproteobacteria bacterium]NIY31146.1 hypothetical protein [Gammaproteobacteria bacterium]
CFFSADHMAGADVIREAVLDASGCLALAGCSAMGVIGAGQEVERKPAVGVMVGRT